MANTVRIHCDHCRREATRGSNRALYCLLCSTLRGAIAMSHYAARCRVCDKRFHRCFRGQTLCSECDPMEGRVPRCSKPFRENKTCAICKDDTAAQLHPDLALCVSCVQSPDPKLHEKVQRVLVKKYKRLAA